MSDDVPMEIGLEEAHRALNSATPPVLVDCREQDEYDLVHLPNARLIPMSQFASRFQELAAVRDTDMIVYCHHGGRSLRVTEFLRRNGYAKSRSLAGGIDGWAASIDLNMPRY